jgi:fructose-1,6-bisphosphatase/sedoheptulose 1,7-bisphosphatase-like protein
VGKNAYLRRIRNDKRNKMKNIPIVILNRDRLHPLVEQITSLKSKGYNNITVIDNQSTYPPLLEWYARNEVDVFHNDITENSCHAFRDLVQQGHPKLMFLIIL